MKRSGLTPTKIRPAGRGFLRVYTWASAARSRNAARAPVIA